MNQSENKGRIVKKGDFVEIEFSGFVDDKLFDSNIESDLKTLNPEAKPEKTLLIVGQRMVIVGLDNFIEGKELNKKYEIKLPPKEAFGSRRTDLVRVLPLKVFHAQRINPSTGSTFFFDNQLAKVIAVSGARVITDFNNPLAGKDVTYKFSIKRIVDDIKEKAQTVCKLVFKYIPEVEVEGEKVLIKGPKILESFVSQSQDKFKEFLGKEVGFKEIEIKKDNKEQTTITEI